MHIALEPALMLHSHGSALSYTLIVLVPRAAAVANERNFTHHDYDFSVPRHGAPPGIQLPVRKAVSETYTAEIINNSIPSRHTMHKSCGRLGFKTLTKIGIDPTRQLRRKVSNETLPTVDSDGRTLYVAMVTRKAGPNCLGIRRAILETSPSSNKTPSGSQSTNLLTPRLGYLQSSHNVAGHHLRAPRNLDGAQNPLFNIKIALIEVEMTVEVDDGDDDLDASI